MFYISSIVDRVVFAKQKINSTKKILIHRWFRKRRYAKYKVY